MLENAVKTHSKNSERVYEQSLLLQSSATLNPSRNIQDRHILGTSCTLPPHGHNGGVLDPQVGILANCHLTRIIENPDTAHQLACQSESC